ncbi:hypothetical protein ACJX0J_026261, partial [Zea mays]
SSTEMRNGPHVHIIWCEVFLWLWSPTMYQGPLTARFEVMGIIFSCNLRHLCKGEGAAKLTYYMLQTKKHEGVYNITLGQETELDSITVTERVSWHLEEDEEEEDEIIIHHKQVHADVGAYAMNLKRGLQSVN